MLCPLQSILRYTSELSRVPTDVQRSEDTPNRRRVRKKRRFQSAPSIRRDSNPGTNNVAHIRIQRREIDIYDTHNHHRKCTRRPNRYTTLERHDHHHQPRLMRRRGLHPVFTFHRRMDINASSRSYRTSHQSDSASLHGEKRLTDPASERRGTHDILYVDLLICSVQDLECDVGGAAEGELGCCEGWEMCVLDGAVISGTSKGTERTRERYDQR